MAPSVSTGATPPGAFVPPAPAASSAAARAPRRCPNCGTAAPDAYCPRCGQEQMELHRSLRAHAEDLFDALAGRDGKIPHTPWCR